MNTKHGKKSKLAIYKFTTLVVFENNVQSANADSGDLTYLCYLVYTFEGEM